MNQAGIDYYNKLIDAVIAKGNPRCIVLPKKKKFLLEGTFVEPQNKINEIPFSFLDGFSHLAAMREVGKKNTII